MSSWLTYHVYIPPLDIPHLGVSVSDWYSSSTCLMALVHTASEVHSWFTSLRRIYGGCLTDDICLIDSHSCTTARLKGLTDWGRETHICVGKLTIIASDNGLSPGRRQAIIWTNAGILLIGSQGTNFNEILIEIHTFSFKKMHLKMSSAKWLPFCLGLNVLIDVSYRASIMSDVKKMIARNREIIVFKTMWLTFVAENVYIWQPPVEDGNAPAYSINNYPDFTRIILGL